MLYILNHKVIIAIAISAILVAMVFAGANIPYPGHNPTDRLISGKGNTGRNSSSGGNYNLPASHNLTLSGNMSNSNNNLLLSGNITISNSTMSRTVNIGSNGTYKITLPEGNYSLAYSSPGFCNQTLLTYLNSNKTKNILMNTPNSIGTGVNEFPASSNISGLVPYLNNSAISGGLNTDNVTGTLDKNISIDLGQKLNYTQFLVLIKLDGAVYDYKGTTNGSGMAELFLKYSGDYAIAAYTLYYNSSFIKYNTSSDHIIKFNMEERKTFTGTLKLHSSEPLNGSSSVAYSTLAGYGGIFHILPSHGKNTSTETYYVYKVPAGFYSFSYYNSNYVSKKFVINVTGNDTINETINPYLISINISNYMGKPYKYTLDNRTYSSNDTFRAIAGANSLNVEIGENTIYTNIIHLSSANPHHRLNITIENKNITLAGNETGSANLSITYSGNIISNLTITTLRFENFSTTGNNGSITISGVADYNGTLVGGIYTYNLTSPLNVTPGKIIIKLVYNPDSNLDKTGTMNVEICGYAISASGTYITE